MRKLASLVRVQAVEPIPDTERLSVATMEGKGWKVVVCRNDFKAGDTAVYFEIDSALPNEDRYAFLRDRCLRKFMTKGGALLKECLRIRTVKLRGVVSQGLLMPVTPETFPELYGGMAYAIGADLTELLRVEHFDELKAALAPQTGNPVAADAMGPFPPFIPKTDEERIQNLVEYFTTQKDRSFEVTVKDDGSSVTMFWSPANDPEHPFGVCSRNLRLKPEKADGTVSLPWLMASKYGVEKKLSLIAAGEYALQGELVGPGIQSNRDLATEHEWHVFRVWDIANRRFLKPCDARDLCLNLDIPYVTVVARCLPVFQHFRDVDSLLAYAEGKTARGHEREGLVFKTVDEPYVSFKAVSNRYLLRQAD